MLVGALVVAIGVAFGFNAGYAINPARDFGPRLFTAVAGWGGGRVHGRRRLVVGADCRPDRSAPCSAGFVYDLCITRLQPAPGARR